MRFSFLFRRNIPLVLLLLSLLLIPYMGSAEEKKPESPDSSEPAKTEVPVVVEDTTGEEAEQTPPAYDYTEPEFDETRASYPLLILRTFAVLAVIIIAIWLIFRFLLKSRNKLVTDTEIIKVLATYPLSANRLIKVIDIAGKILILGVTDSNINLITEVEDKELIDRIKLISSKEAAGKGSFKEQFFRLIGGRAFSKAGEVSYLRGYKDRINRMKKL